MLLTLSFTFVGALGSSLLSIGSTSTIFTVISVCRLILGVGVGGLYPLSAARTAEADLDVAPDATKIGWSFFWQTPGSLLPYIVGWIISAKDLDVSDEVQYRIIFGMGAIPVLAVIIAEATRAKTDAENRSSNSTAASKEVQRAAYTEAMRGPSSAQHWRHLIGTGGSWFVYDIAYYGTAIFQPQILKTIFHTSSLSYWQNLVVGSMGIPGVICSILLVKRVNMRMQNICGFLLIAVSFAALAICFMITPKGLENTKFVIFCFNIFALNFGPNVATYVIPATLYPKEVRTTFHGMSAGCGKLGAVVGTFMYTPINKAFGIATVLWVQVVLSVIGALVSIYFLPRNTDQGFVSSSSIGINTRLTAPVRGRGGSKYSALD